MPPAYWPPQDTLKSCSDLVGSFAARGLQRPTIRGCPHRRGVAAALLPSFTDSDEALPRPRWFAAILNRRGTPIHRFPGRYSTDDHHHRLAAGQLKDSVSYDALVEMSVAERL